MLDYYSALKTTIQRGEYLLDDMETRIERCWIDTHITMEQRDELLALAAECARDEYQVDMLAMYAALDQRVFNLEHPVDQYEIWYNGKVTLKGEIVRWDVTGDGEYDLCLFDGGNSKTSLSVGKIDGWYLLDRELNRTHEIHRNADGTYRLDPVEVIE